MPMIRQIGLFVALGFAALISGEDWPQWRGLRRDGIWRESGILEAIPSTGLQVLWRAPVGFGYSSPVIVEGRVYIHDSRVTKTNAQENIRCLNAQTGATIWTRSYNVVYPEYGADPEHGFGPVATPVVAKGKIYTYGRMANLFCLDAATGRTRWSRDLRNDYGTTEDLRGPNSSPIVEGDAVVVTIAKSSQVSLAAFNRNTGKPMWEALDEIPSNTSPIAIDAPGGRQIVVWAYKSVAALDPKSGRILWRVEMPPAGNYTAATPVWKDDQLLLSGLMLKLNSERTGASILWPEELRSTRIYRSDTSTPLLQEGVAFEPTAQGQIVCVEAASGKQLWQTDPPIASKNGASIHIVAVPAARRALLFTDRGDLILAELSAAGYREHGRFHLLEPTSEYGQQKMAWTPPAYANGCVFARNDKEVVCASLRAAQK